MSVFESVHGLLWKKIKSGCLAVEDFPIMELDVDGFFNTPAFDSEPSLVCLQEDYLGFYVVPIALANYFRSINFLIAAQSSLELKLYAPSVAMSYTAAYHTVGAFLALNGRLWLDEPPLRVENQGGLSRGQSGKIYTGYNKPVIAKLTKRNRWVYEDRKRSHKARWSELGCLFRSSDSKIPKSFQNLFDYSFKGSHKRVDDLIDYVRNPEKYRLGIRDCMTDFFGNIPLARHFSQYAGFGGDPHVHSALMNGDYVDPERLGDLAEAYYSFSHGLGMEVCRELCELQSSLGISSDLREKIMIRVHWPQPVDEPRTELIEDDELRERFSELWALFATVERSPESR